MSDRMMGVRDGLGLALTYPRQHRLDSVHSILVRLQVETEDRDEEDDVDGWVSPSEVEASQTSVPDDSMATSLMRSRELCEPQLSKDARRDVRTSL